MIKKMMLLAALAFTLVGTLSANDFAPFPGCYPCNGDGN